MSPPPPFDQLFSARSANPDLLVLAFFAEIEHIVHTRRTPPRSVARLNLVVRSGWQWLFPDQRREWPAVPGVLPATTPARRLARPTLVALTK